MHERQAEHVGAYGTFECLLDQHFTRCSSDRFTAGDNQNPTREDSAGRNRRAEARTAWHGCQSEFIEVVDAERRQNTISERTIMENGSELQSVPSVLRVEAQAFPVNAYLVETENGIVVVDSLLTVSDARALRARLEDRRKPLLAVFVTHAHPDHYAGLTELVAGDDVPILATQGVTDVIRRDDPAKNAILGPMFGNEWPRERIFPNRTVEDGETVTFDGVRFRAVDLGPGESPHDSIWVLDGDEPRAFVGDVVYNRMHGYLADGHYEAWLRNLERVGAMFAPETVLYVGHGDTASPALLDWQAGYIRTFVEAVEAAARAGDDADAAAQRVTDQARAYLSGDDLLFLMQLSIEPIRALIEARRGSIEAS